MKEKDSLHDWFAKAYPEQTPPSGHEQRFIKKLSPNTILRRQRLSFRIAAVALIIIGLGSAFGEPTPSQDVNKFYQTEILFQRMIQNQLEDLSPQEDKHQVFFDAGNRQLERLQLQYNIQMEQFKNGIDHPKILQALIKNLRKQLEVVESISHQIESSKSKKNELDLL